jgi:hypothetical protein
MRATLILFADMMLCSAQNGASLNTLRMGTSKSSDVPSTPTTWTLGASTVDIWSS